MNKGSLFVITGPSGAGKGTVLKEVIKSLNRLYFSVSATTRKPREGEVDGVHYHFLTKERFEELISADRFLEYVVPGYCSDSVTTMLYKWDLQKYLQLDLKALE